MTRIPAEHQMPPPPDLTLEEALRALRAIDWMFELIDPRYADDSMAPKPFELRDTEVRDIRRFCRGDQIFTDAGREGRAIASEELGS